MMAEITYQMVLNTIQTVGLLVGIAYYIMTLNYTRKNQEISLRNQKRTLETRHATIYNQLMGPVVSPMGIKKIQLLNDNPFSNNEEFIELANSVNEFSDAWVWMCNQYEMMGINHIEGVADIDFFARHSPWFTLKLWRQSKPVIYERRKKYGRARLVIIQEQMYNRMIWDDHLFYSFAENPEMHDNTIIVDSLSKTYGMPGWRLGYIIIPPRFKEKIKTHLWQIAAGTNLHIQKAGTAALTGPQDIVNNHMKKYEDRLNYAYDFWSSLDGVTVNKPKGAYYIFPNISSFGLSSEEFYSYIRKEAKVELFPGYKFGTNGEGHIRQCTAFPLKLQEEAFSRIEKALCKLRK